MRRSEEGTPPYFVEGCGGIEEGVRRGCGGFSENANSKKLFSKINGFLKIYVKL